MDHRSLRYKGALMEIPPIPSAQPPQERPPQISLVDQLDNLWNNWWNDPNEKTGTALLNFLKQNEKVLVSMGSQKPCPFPGMKASFEHIYTTAINYLETWMNVQHCDPNKVTPVSQWINDIFKWLKS